MKKILSIFLALAMILSMLVLAIPTGATGTSATTTPDLDKAGNTVITDENRAEYIEKLREEGYKELDYAQMVAGLESNSKYFLTGDFDLVGRATEFNLPISSSTDATESFGLGSINIRTTGNVIIDGCGYSLSLDTPLFMYSANITVKNLTFKGTIDSYKISKDGGAFSVLSLWNHWGYCNMENVTSEVTVSTTNHSIDGRSNDSQKLAALAIDAKDSTFKNVKVVGNHTAEEVSDNLVAVGAIVGVTTGTCVFEDCVSLGNTVIKSKKLKNTNGVGGMVGYVNGNAEFKNCYNARSITVESSNVMNCVANIGGFAGKVAGSASFDGCVNAGRILVNGNMTENESAVGGFVGFAEGKVTIKSSESNENITFGAKTAYQGDEGVVNREVYFGGFIGRAAGGVEMTDCAMNADMILNTTATGLGGLVGLLEKKFSNSFEGCANNGTITFAKGATLAQPRDMGMGMGGLVGMSKGESVSFDNCVNNNPITFTIAACDGASAVGGLLGYQYISDAETVAFNNCTNYGDITQTGDFDPLIGGICGAVRGAKDVSFVNCVNEGDILHAGKNEEWAYAGGIIGVYGDCGNWMSTDKSAATVLDVYCCINKGNVTATSHAGGIVGSNNEIDHAYNTMNFFACQNTGAIKSLNNNGKAAGIIGEAFGKGDINVRNSVNEGSIAGVHAGGILSAANNSDRTFINASVSNCKNTGEIAGVVSAGGIAANLLATNTLTMDSCYNGAKVSATAAQSENPIAGGILGYTTKVSATVNGCVNAGQVVCAAGTSKSAVTHTKVILGEGCANYYLTGCVTDGTTAHATAKSQGEIDGMVKGMKFLREGNPYHLNNSVKAANALVAGDYTDATWVKVKAALETAVAADANFTATQTQIDEAKAALDAAIAALVIDVIDYAGYDAAVAKVKALNKDDWNSTTWLELQRAVDAVEALKTVEGTLQSEVDAAVKNIDYRIEKLEERGETGGQIDVDAMGQLNTGGTLRPEKPTGTQAPTTEAPTEAPTEPVEESGCGGIIGGAAVVLMAVAAVGVGVSLKKKED